MAETRAHDCDIHLVPLDETRGCTYCLRFLANAPDAKELTLLQRLDELEQWLTARHSVPEEVLYRRIEELAGRGISIHELDDPDLFLRRAQRPQRQMDYWDW
jgi:hypothetical protein